jgi:hypothetical protein
MESVRELQKKYCFRAMAIAIAGALLLIVLGHKGLGKGLVLGTLFSILNFILMAETLPMRIQKTRKAAFATSLFSVGVRYVLLSVPLILAVKLEQIHLLTVVIGIFMVQAIIFADHVFASSRST